MGNIASIISAAFRLFGAFQTLEYDVIVVGGGAGGCPLAQTLADSGRKVLLLERGGEPPSDVTATAVTFARATLSECIESFNSDGVVVSTGRCLGGATSINQGIYIEPDLVWLQDHLPATVAMTDVEAAFAWVAERVSPTATSEPAGSNAKVWIDALTDSLDANGIPLSGDPTVGQRRLTYDSAWRGHSIFDNDFSAGQRRRSAATNILNRSHPNLTVMLHAEVVQVKFDGDWFLPWTARVTASSTSLPPQARCVLLASLEQLCVKEAGRIYLAAGVFHTPELLMKSGIGPGGHRVDNPEVGQHLMDKPIAPTTAFFQPTFDYDGLLAVAHLPALAPFTTEDNANDVVYGLYEEISIGIPDQLISVGVYERVYQERPGRFSLVGDALGLGLRYCLDREGVIPTLLNLIAVCNSVNAFIDAGCTERAVIFATILSQPTSVGSVERDFFGNLKVNANYLGTSQDRKALFLAFEKAQTILADVAGPAALERPGQGTCPNLFADTLTTTASIPIMLNSPSIASGTSQSDGGEILFDRVIAAHHFAGTAAFGRVVDDRFRVVGVNGLYVADASVYPMTPPVNIMASTLMIGRLAGVYAVDEMMTV